MHADRYLVLVAALMLVGRCGCTSPADRAFEAAWAKKAETVWALVEAHPQLSRTANADGFTLLYAALVHQQFELANRLLDAGADPLRLDPEGITPLHWATFPGGEGIVKRLLAVGADPNAKTPDLKTPLQWAASGGSSETVERLLAAGADPFAGTEDNDTPLIAAAAGGYVKIVERLLAEGASIESLDRALLEAGFGECRAQRRLGYPVDLVERDPDEKKDLEACLADYRAIAHRLRAKRARVPGTSSVWQAAKAKMPDRMVLAMSEGYYRSYRAIWKRDDGEYLVGLQTTGGSLGFGPTYDVAVFDRTMKLVRRGEVDIVHICDPYALVEARSTSNEMPKPLRNHWLLGVAAWWRDRTFHEDRPIGIDNVEVREGAKLNKLYGILVEWPDAEDLPHRQFSAFKTPLEVRWAEPGPSPLWRAE